MVGRPFRRGSNGPSVGGARSEIGPPSVERVMNSGLQRDYSLEFGLRRGANRVVKPLYASARCGPETALESQRTREGLLRNLRASTT